MKKIHLKIYLVAALMITLFLSCEEILEETPRGPLLPLSSELKLVLTEG